MVRTHGLTHIALAVRDVERSSRFYREVFGVVETYHCPGFVQVETPGSHDVIVLEQASAEEAGEIGRTGGIRHFGFRLVDPADVDEIARAVEEAGGTIRSRGEFCPGEPYVFASDPDGYEIEIWYE
ncbi:MAG TPA: VOC family protein [Thermoanaerobaculia bacterium]|nr:VOC family protein [Thermoanaerobaculia bacterium]